MRGLFVGTVGALVLVIAAFGLSLDAFRAGPFDRTLDQVTIVASAEGTYHSRAASTGPLGTCLQPPCDACTRLALTIRGLPNLSYEIRLDGPAASEVIGTFRASEGVLKIQWEHGRDHDDKGLLVLTVAGRDVSVVPVRGSATPIDLSGPLSASWRATPGEIHVNEIGGVTISTVARTRLQEEAPSGWEFRARFQGPNGHVDLGAFDADGDEVVLDGRVERLRLEDYEHLVVVVAPIGEQHGFPVLQASLWPEATT